MRTGVSAVAAASIVLAGLAVSCNHDTLSDGAPPSDSRATEMAAVEMHADDALDPLLDREISAAAPASETGLPGTVTKDVTFSRTRQCPAGGEILWEGSLHWTYDFETRTMEATFSGTRTMTECAFVRNDLTIVLNGSSQWDAFRRKVDGRFDGLQTNHHSGSFHAVRSDGEEWSCSFDVTIARDPAAHTRTVDGSFCGVTVHQVVTWQSGP